MESEINGPSRSLLEVIDSTLSDPDVRTLPQALRKVASSIEGALLNLSRNPSVWRSWEPLDPKVETLIDIGEFYTVNLR